MILIKRNPKIIKRNYEKWKSIKGFPGYKISNMGRVKSLDRLIKRSNGVYKHKGMILQPSKTDDYAQVGLSKKGKRIDKTMHLLVIAHFGKPQPSPKHECNHIDGIKSNNWWSNLEWMTHKENLKHARDTGLWCPQKGKNHGMAKLSDKQIRKIRILHKSNKYFQWEIGQLFGVTPSTIYHIIHYKTWKHIK